MKRPDFFHHRRVDAEPAGGVDDQHVVVMSFCPGDRRADDVGWFLIAARRKKIRAGLCGNCFELLDGGWPIDVGGHH